MNRQNNTMQAADPFEPPPSYDEVVSGPSASGSNTLQVPPETGNRDSPLTRRPTEDETRELPPGWMRLYDSKEKHHYFVDTTTNPPRSTWNHPYEDEEYLNSLSPPERARIQKIYRATTDTAVIAEGSTSSERRPTPPPRPHTTGEAKGARKLGRRMKDALTNSTHEEREARRRERAEQERRAYEMQRRFRIALTKAMETGVPQFLGKDSDGKEVYVEPPYGPGGQQYAPRGYAGGAYGYNPYAQGPYTNPNARFLRPQQPNNLDYAGYGPIFAAPLLGLGAGMLLGGLML